jgi:hypothetical protein
MNVWWHNGGVRLDPETDEERAALLVLWRGASKELPVEQRVQHGSGPCVVGEQLFGDGIVDQEVTPRGAVV